MKQLTIVQILFESGKGDSNLEANTLGLDEDVMTRIATVNEGVCTFYACYKTVIGLANWHGYISLHLLRLPKEFHVGDIKSFRHFFLYSSYHFSFFSTTVQNTALTRWDFKPFQRLFSGIFFSYNGDQNINNANSRRGRRIKQILFQEDGK